MGLLDSVGLGPLVEVGGKLIDRLIPDPAAAAKAKQELATLEQNGELAKMANESKMFEVEETNVSTRWTADMASDSWLSKNIRPLTLIFLLGAYFTFAMMSAFDLETRGAYVELLGQWGQLVMLAYFGGRSLEKIMEQRKDKS